MPDFIQGSCENMCPEAEIRLRTKERLLNYFELKAGQKNVPDNAKLIKSFSRSAAGIKTPKKTDLRTIRALQNTIDYLLKNIILDKRKSFSYVYDFIFDRLRCVRQEIVIQNLNTVTTIKLLEPIILFLAYSRYRLCEESVDNFDPKICEQHLQECLKKVLCCYDEIDSEKTDRTICEDINRNFIECLYQIFNLGSPESLQRSLQLSLDIRNNPLFSLAQQISLEYFKGNFYRAMSLINKLPHILCATCSIKIQHLRKHLYMNFSHGYSSKQFVVPINFIKDIVYQSTVEDVLNDCQYYNIEIIISDKQKSLKFSKSDFDMDKPAIKSKHEKFVDDKLKEIYLPEVLLLKKF